MLSVRHLRYNTTGKNFIIMFTSQEISIKQYQAGKHGERRTLDTGEKKLTVYLTGIHF